MARSDATTVDQYLDELPDERRAVVAAVRDTILTGLPRGYEEAMRWGMICYEVPQARYPDTYNGQPLCYVSLAAQKHHYAIYLTCASADPAHEAWLEREFAAAGKRLDKGRSCVRFKRLEDLPLPVVREAVASTPPERLIALYEAGRAKK